MPTDDERRDVAGRLRFNAGTALRMNTSHDFAREVFRAAMSEEIADYRAAIKRLADLIEPSEPEVKCVAEVKIDGERLESLVHDAVAELTGIDRDALLELAEEMDAYTRCSDDDRCGKQMPPLVIHEFARRIRKALGVE